jgi:hypothetical protein
MNISKKLANKERQRIAALKRKNALLRKSNNELSAEWKARKLKGIRVESDAFLQSLKKIRC